MRTRHRFRGNRGHLQKRPHLIRRHLVKKADPVSNVMDSATEHDEIYCADLFAGAGGFSLGAQIAGVRVVMAAESDSHAVATYKANFIPDAKGQPKVFDGDIRALDPSKVARDTFQVGASCDILLGGPPCQGFSTHRIKGAGIEDGRNALIHTYFEFVRAFAPTAFLMENVPGMLWPRHESYLTKFTQEAVESGYHIYSPVVVDARDYGVPQRRRRVFILGVREGIDRTGLEWPPKPTHGSERSRVSNPDLLPWEACASAFEPAAADDGNDVHMNSGKELVEAFQQTPLNGGSRHDSGRLLPCHDGHDGHNDVYGRINPAEPAPTMTTACINPSKGRFVHPTDHHGITARQAARIQTFPDGFHFHGGLMAAGKQVGNAVPPKLAAHLISCLIPMLVKGRQRSSSSANHKEIK